MRVGVIGLGTMGGNAARNIMRHGFDLVVHDIRREAAEPLIEFGAEWSETPADLISRVDVAVTMVFGPKEIEQVVRGENGLLSGDCAGKTWIDLTTSRPALMRGLGQECQSASKIDPLSACNIDPLSGTAEVVPVVNRGDPSGFV